MSSTSSKTATTVWIGRVLTTLVALFLGWDSIFKIISHPMSVQGTIDLGFKASQVQVIGLIALPCLLIYLFPKTALLGAVLLTGYLGGAEATHLRANPEPFTLIFPIIIGAFVWGGLYLRNSRVRRVLPILGADW